MGGVKDILHVPLPPVHEIPPKQWDSLYSFKLDKLKD